jgi:protein-S-isoprenylcysteine O-methyltransferase Ste14
MSHRTKDLQPLTGLPHFVRELRYQEIARQGLAVVLILVFTLVASPRVLAVAIGMPLALVGMLVRLFASGYILKNQELAQQGPYALVRHPLYTGNILLIVGFALASNVFWTLLLALAFFWFYYPTAIEYEDRKLKRIFGSAWHDWATQTPALLPQLSTAGVWDGNWSLQKSLRNNGELFIVVYVLICSYFVIAPVI